MSQIWLNLEQILKKWKFFKFAFGQNWGGDKNLKILTEL